MRIAIIGSTDLTNTQRLSVAHLIEMIVAQYYPDYSILVSGGAEGVDSIAEEIADHSWYGGPSIIHLPENKRWEPRGYKARNLKIIEDADVMYCIRSRQSKTYGSGWTADQAENSMNVWRYYV